MAGMLVKGSDVEDAVRRAIGLKPGETLERLVQRTVTAELAKAMRGAVATADPPPALGYVDGDQGSSLLERDAAVTRELHTLGQATGHDVERAAAVATLGRIIGARRVA